MSATATALTGLKRQRPEWGAWLDVIEEALRESDTGAWDAAVPANAAPRAASPILADTTVAVDARTLRHLLQRLIRVASRSGTPEMATLRAVLNANPDVLLLFAASLRHDNAAIAEAAASYGANAGALEAVLALATVPLLHACNRRWASSIPRSWLHGYCPVCGAWPAFAELRGIERNRFFRCGRCGGEWGARPLHCSYCGEHDHNALVSFVPERGELNAAIEGCRSCRRYGKTFTRLQGSPPGAVMLEDLASVQLDLAALEQGYSRPSNAGQPIDVTVTARPPARSLFRWNS